ncbi:uncharacterized protein J8A68_004844 [[Candida] subhashii]|uniref:DUF2433 domain-containing protein n=1 Tax=[Candida] subhashii TaxID=561895 RepID=A0A8J5QID9_9ASCO|nr:uncharacterized protein J8A68_004844 [[Candida] subhashii]KAG7661691.1 hypothetical protein J8A68_004844 [[Candida] subhashii]
MTTTINSLRILTISDIQGNVDSLTELYNQEIKQGRAIDLIIHTGNFGFWDKQTIELTHELNYLKQIISFSDLLDSNLVEELNNQSTIVSSNDSSINGNEELVKFKSLLLQSKTPISQFQQYLEGIKTLPCPVYTIFGPLDDPRIINKIQTRQYEIPNLFLIDHKNNYEIETPIPNLPNLRIYGIGGTVKIHNLFDRGNLEYEDVCGKIGELWISLLQIAEFYLQFSNTFTPSINSNTINIFVTHAPVIKTPLLEHLAIITHADFTISQGLHFRYPVMGNGMSFVDSMGGSAGYVENYRGKFSRLRMILGELWVVIKDDLMDLLSTTEVPGLKNLIELGLSLFDKIPIIVNDTNDKIVQLTLSPDDENEDEINKKVVKRLNDCYFQAYYNLWHFNLCDHRPSQHEEENQYNIMIFKFDQYGNFKLDYCNSQGFNFGFKTKQQQQEISDDIESEKRTTTTPQENNQEEEEASSLERSNVDEETDEKPRSGTIYNKPYRGSYRGGSRGGGGGGNGWAPRGSRGSYRGRGSSGGYRNIRGRGGRGSSSSGSDGPGRPSRGT